MSIKQTIDADRIARAAGLTVVLRQDGKFEVESRSGKKPRVVDLNSGNRVSCPCPDSIYRHETACKHTLAALLYVGKHPQLKEKYGRALVLVGQA